MAYRPDCPPEVLYRAGRQVDYWLPDRGTDLAFIGPFPEYLHTLNAR
jgi:hypothetical protein